MESKFSVANVTIAVDTSLLNIDNHLLNLLMITVHTVEVLKLLKEAVLENVKMVVQFSHASVKNAVDVLVLARKQRIMSGPAQRNLLIKTVHIVGVLKLLKKTGLENVKMAL
ncbi:hypothetical protein [Nostoc sp.]|uniref:hypothetical protein n=1 Tax=Nostoc sp. TaxID=1180 RepID=UPI002FF47A9B